MMPEVAVQFRWKTQAPPGTAPWNGMTPAMASSWSGREGAAERLKGSAHLNHSMTAEHGRDLSRLSTIVKVHQQQTACFPPPSFH